VAPRESLPGELFLDAIVVYPTRALDVLRHGFGAQDYAQMGDWDPETADRAGRREPYIALRWVLNPALGVPLTPFTVWRRAAFRREPAQPIPGWHVSGFDTWTWDGVTEMLRIELDLTGPVTATGLHRADLQPVQTVSGVAGNTIVLDAGPMLGVRIDNPGAVAAQRGQSLVTLANGAGWEPFEIVGLPFGPPLAGTTYYQGDQQGMVGALTDPVDAAIQRLTNWGPVVGWGPLVGVPPWRPPDPKLLVEELQGDVLPDLVQVMAAHPPPLVGQQITASVTHKLERLSQIIGIRSLGMNSGAAGDRSEITVRPLQSVSLSVACDTWASLALGFGTGDHLAQGDAAGHGGNDYMVTTRWDGLLSTAVQVPWPWPWTAPPPVYITREVQRELAAIVLSPDARGAPAGPSPIMATLGHDEGADDIDGPYNVSVTLQTSRPPMLPRQPRAAGFGLARYDKPGTGEYQLREHPLAKGWIPIGSAAPVANPGDPPVNPPDTVTLRNSGVPRPVTGPPNTYQYVAAATDLFGQWSPWAAAWYSLPAAGVQAPVVAAEKAHARPGPGDADPCPLTVTAEITWNSRERSLHQLQLSVDVFPPTPPPPAAYDDPPASPQGGAVTVTTATLAFSLDGSPLGPPPGVTVSHVHDDDTPVTVLDPTDRDERRYRIVIADLPVTFGGNHELAVVLYAQAEETVRPGEWSGWVHSREIAIVANPIPPPVPAPLPLVYPDWASLPDAAGLSYASVTWTPTGAWRYRVYEATEAALRAACGLPGPTLTDGLAERMQALFDLYKVPDNLPILRRTFRKLGSEPVLPPVQADGTMRLDSLLPRGSSLIHCYVVAGVTEANVVSYWPAPDGDGRRAFHAFAIPHPRQAALPQIIAALDGAGTPQVTVYLDGSVPATSIRLYRAANAILARSIGTMDLIASVPPGSTAPDFWKRTTIADPGAPVGWAHVQYRAVALTDDDPERAGMAVPSEPSRAYALLNPPPNPPTLTLTPNVAGTTATVAVVRVDTDAARKGSDIGDFALGCTITAPSLPPVRFSSSLPTVPDFPSAAAFSAGTETAGYVGGVLFVRLNRTPGQALGLAVDVTDPLARSTHAVIDVPPDVPDPPPVVTLAASRLAGIVRLRIDTNVPLPPDPMREWELEIGTQPTGPPPGPPVTRTFAVSAIPTIAGPAGMPNPAVDPAPSQIRRVDGSGLILMWGRASTASRIAVRLTNSFGQSATASEVLP
jgi:hypothetical protein